MLEWVTLLLTMAERLTIHSLDMRKPLLWCSVACFLLMLTSIYLLLTLFFLSWAKELYCYSWMYLKLIISLLSFVVRFPDLRDALEKLQLNDAALKVILICWKIVHLLFLDFCQRIIICFFLYMLSPVSCNLLFNYSFSWFSYNSFLSIQFLL